ncbi:uncharacterized protein PEZ65_018881 [Lycodopsis pacificus]
MSKVQMLRCLVNQRLTAAAEEIFGVFERTIAEYEEQLSRSQEQNERQRKLLDAVFIPQLQLHRADVQQLLVVKEEVPPEQQEWSSSLDQEDPEPPHMKEDQEDPEPPHIKEDQEDPEPPHIKEDQEDPEPPHIKEDQEDSEPPHIKEDQEDSEPPHIKEDQEDSEPPHIKEEQEDPEPPHIKEEQEELWTSQEGEQLQGLEEADIKFPFTPVKSEDDEEEAQSSQLHQRQTEQMETEADGEDCGGPEPDRNSDPDRHLQLSSSETASQCYKQETEVCDDWNETSEPQSGLNFMKNKECNSPEKQFSCCECGKRFNQNSNLKTHMRTHTGEKPFSCSVCGKRFGQKAHLQNHLKCHTGEKPYSCLFCNKCFARSEHLQLHMRTHTGEKPFSCNVCGKRFTWLGQFKSHKCGGESSQFHELWTGQRGEQPQVLEEFHVAKFPFPPAPARSEDDERRPQSSQLHRRHGEDCGGPGPARNSDPDSLGSHGLMYNSFIGQFW